MKYTEKGIESKILHCEGRQPEAFGLVDLVVGTSYCGSLNS